jgi:membrane protease YdiL (CAAX protease family)
VVLLVAVAPRVPARRLPWPAAALLGACCGVVLFAALARRRPRLPPLAQGWPALAGQVAVLGLWAANEEVIWRRVLLGELLPTGVVPAVAASTAGFALLHRGEPLYHLATGCLFGTAYLATGVLAASIAAHWTYNVLVGGHVIRARDGPG